MGALLCFFCSVSGRLCRKYDSPCALFAQGLFVVTLLYPIVVATVNKDITEESEKITKVKRIVKKRIDSLEHKTIEETPIDDVVSWKELEFSHPENTVRLGTLFSGIGAIEHAFQRLGLKHQIVFAGDIEPNCKKSYFANYEIKEEDWFSDIREFDARKYGPYPCSVSAN